jgi:hydrogenase maturation factor
MPDTGKIDRQFFEEYIASTLGAARDDIRLGPTHGVDFGAVEVGEHALVVATDPLSVLPALGFERAGRFAVRFALADVAVSGLAPTHLAVSFTLPPAMTDAEFAAVWRGVDAECRALGTAVVTGHTARYAGCQFPWVGSATAMAVGDPDEIVRPDGARPGDRLLVTKGPAVETTGLLTTLFPDQIPLADDVLATAQKRLAETAIAGDALAAADAAPVSAMHDATEGGLLGALFELADSAGVRVAVERDAVPTPKQHFERAIHHPVCGQRDWGDRREVDRAGLELLAKRVIGVAVFGGESRDMHKSVVPEFPGQISDIRELVDEAHRARCFGIIVSVSFVAFDDPAMLRLEHCQGRGQQHRLDTMNLAKDIRGPVSLARLPEAELCHNARDIVARHAEMPRKRCARHVFSEYWGFLL